jgi:hypothetical protein
MEEEKEGGGVLKAKEESIHEGVIHIEGKGVYIYI